VSYADLAKLDVTFRPIDSWPGPLNHGRRYSLFTASFRDTVEILATELRLLRAKHIVLQVALDERMIRLDGFPRADARASHPGVILSFDSKWGPLQYASDEFTKWEDNLRGIAKSMEALRLVDRYGVSKKGEQYRGWRALPTGGSGDDPVQSLTFDKAERLIEQLGGRAAALKKTHPDTGGDQEQVRIVLAALDLVGAK
jgi:hypothetical protein